MKVYVRQHDADGGTPLLRLDLDDADVQRLTWSQLVQLTDIINTCTEAEANHDGGDQPCTVPARRRFTVMASKRSQRFDA